MMDSTDSLLAILVPFSCIAVACLMVAVTGWQNRRADAIIDDWARQNGYKVLSMERSWLAGPFFWRKSRGQVVYRLQVEDVSGRRSTAWARCGHWFMGLWSDEITVEWEDKQESRRSSI
jgi:hypothetical protein